MQHKLHVISQLSWIGEVWLSSTNTMRLDWTICLHNGFEPAADIQPTDAVWITPGLLVAQNSWLASNKQPQILLRVPPKHWVSSLNAEFLGRTISNHTVQEIRNWHDIPPEFGDEPWSQVSEGRAQTFPAAQRNLSTLQAALTGFDHDLNIQLSEHIPDIEEEWAVCVHNNQVIASSGYCVHTPAGSRIITTVFDNVQFDESHRELAQKLVEQATHTSALDTGVVIVAFRQSSSVPIIIEVSPVWCSSPYRYGERTERVLTAIAESRVLQQDGVYRTSAGQPVSEQEVYRADSPTRASYSRRFQSFYSREAS